jgi:AcrR family transcriptional regulator
MAPRKYELGRRAEAIEETRRRIVDATFDLHGEKGVVATSMQEIAARADVALRTVYNHYPTIDDLVAGCGKKVMAVLAPPTPEIFSGTRSFEARVRRLIEELFAMYARGPEMIEVARCEQSQVPTLREFTAEISMIHMDLAREALKPFRPRSHTINEVVALTDFYVWRAFNQQGISTRQAADVIHRGLAMRGHLWIPTGQPRISR